MDPRTDDKSESNEVPQEADSNLRETESQVMKILEGLPEEERTKTMTTLMQSLEITAPAPPYMTCKPYDASNSEVNGFLIDLDGTIYKPGGLIEGAVEFVAWLIASKTPFVFLSNTGAKGSVGVQSKLSKLKITEKRLPLRHCFTAAEAQIEYMVETIPPRAKVFVVAGGSESFWMEALRAKSPLLCDSWELRTDLTDEEAKEWTVHSLKYPNSVFVVFFVDGEITQTIDPSTSEAGFADWSYDIIKKTTFLVSGGAQFIYTADDAFNPSTDDKFPDIVFPLPGPGMFAAMLQKASYPLGMENMHCPGKGGNEGARFMMNHAVEMLKLQGHSGDLSKIMMVGDRFDTDIAGAVSIGCKSCLVESGCHDISMQEHYKQFPADYFAPNVEHLVPGSSLSKHVSFSVEEDSSISVQQELPRRSSMHRGYASISLRNVASNLSMGGSYFR